MKLFHIQPNCHYAILFRTKTWKPEGYKVRYRAYKMKRNENTLISRVNCLNVYSHKYFEILPPIFT